MQSYGQVGSVGPVVKGNLGKVAKMTNNELLMRFDKKYSLYRNLNLTMNQAFQKVETRELITYENSQMLEFRKRRDYTNEWEHYHTLHFYAFSSYNLSLDSGRLTTTLARSVQKRSISVLVSQRTTYSQRRLTMSSHAWSKYHVHGNPWISLHDEGTR